MFFVWNAQAADLKKLAAEIDTVISQKLAAIQQPERAGIDDYTFVRRLYLNAIGRIPTLIELETFINDKSQHKRSQLITKLLSSKGHHSHMYTYWSDLLRIKYTGDQLHYPGNLSQAVKTAIRENRPYDAFVRDVVSATGPIFKKGNGLAGYKAREVMQLDRLANTVKSFLGVSIECAQCHDDPFDDWTQKQFYEMAAFNSNVRHKADPPQNLEKSTYGKMRPILKKESFDIWIVYREALRMKYSAIQGSGTGYMRLPHDYQYDDGKPHDVMKAKTMFGATPTTNYKFSQKQLQKHKNKRFIGPDEEALIQFSNWMTAKKNPMFSKATVNRLWKWVMGTELVGPIANLDLGVEGKHSELTNKLVETLEALNYDTRKFFEVIFLTRAYQSQSLSLKESSPDYIFDGPVMQRMTAQQTWDSLLSLRMQNPDQFVPTQFHYDGFTHFNEISQEWTVDDFVKYARESGLNRAQLSNVQHRAAQKRNEPVGPLNMTRASEVEYKAHQDNKDYLEVASLFGASTRDLIDGASVEPNIPQALYMMNGKPEEQVIRKGSFLKKKILTSMDKPATLWKAILGRPLHDREKPFTEELKSLKDLEDMAWALLNSNEFRFVR